MNRCLNIVLLYALASLTFQCRAAAVRPDHDNVDTHRHRRPMPWREASKLAKANGMTCDTGSTPLFLRLEPPDACVMRSTPTGHEIDLDPTNYFSHNVSTVKGCGTAYWAIPPFGNVPECIFFANVGKGRACRALRCAAGTGYTYTQYDPATSLPPTYTCQKDSSFSLDAHGATNSELGCQPCPNNTYNDGTSHACRPKRPCAPGQFVASEAGATADRECADLPRPDEQRADDSGSASRPGHPVAVWVVGAAVGGAFVLVLGIGAVGVRAWTRARRSKEYVYLGSDAEADLEESASLVPQSGALADV